MTAATTVRDRVRAQLADLKMTGALEALDEILRQLDSGSLPPAAAIEALLGAQITLRNNRRLLAAMRSSRLPAVKTRYLPISCTGAMLFFQLMSRRYETGSTILTSNKSFNDWGDIFGDPVMATALIDRLFHHCHIVNIRGNSYRIREHRELAALLQPHPDAPPPRRRTEARSS